MQSKSSGLTSLQTKAIQALLSTRTRAEAAEVAGCSERSIYNWLAEPLFSTELLKRENILRREIGRRLSQDAGRVIDLLQSIIEDEIADVRLRLRAADLWLSYIIRTQDYSEIEERLTKLEVSNEYKKTG